VVWRALEKSWLVISLKDLLVPALEKLLICTCTFILRIYEEFLAVQTLCTCKFDFQLMFS
jgi:hypothetical protein